jgi:hypothetical protein
LDFSCGLSNHGQDFHVPANFLQIQLQIVYQVSDGGVEILEVLMTEVIVNSTRASVATSDSEWVKGRAPFVFLRGTPKDVGFLASHGLAAHVANGNQSGGFIIMKFELKWHSRRVLNSHYCRRWHQRRRTGLGRTAPSAAAVKFLRSSSRGHHAPSTGVVKGLFLWKFLSARRAAADRDWYLWPHRLHRMIADSPLTPITDTSR